jgi:hypothetical protein
MAPSDKSRAQGFADHFNSVLNRTVTRGRLSVVVHPGAPRSFDIVCRHGPLALNGSPLFLFVSQRVEVESAKVHTDLYSYRLLLDPEDRRRSWVVRWEHYRQRPDSNPYVLSHLHVNGTVKGAEHAHKSLDRLHLPTARVPFELVLWHLITEWSVEPIGEDWADVLQGSLDGFIERRTTGI